MLNYTLLQSSAFAPQIPFAGRFYLKKVEKGEYQVKDALNYIELIAACEKVGDHVINVSEGITGQI